ncbi:MAG: hypothetical protein WC070_01045 [Candidatus Magasanikbacteria bacterium]
MDNPNHNPENKESELLKFLEKAEKNSSGFTSISDSNSSSENNTETTSYYKNKTEKIDDFSKGAIYIFIFIALFAAIIPYLYAYTDMIFGIWFYTIIPIFFIITFIYYTLKTKRYYLIVGMSSTIIIPLLVFGSCFAVFFN